MKTQAWLVAVVLLAGAGCTGAGSENDGGGEYGARDVCQQFVESRLKSPGSADFSSEDATDNGDGSWTVTGDVDSENSFGASIRNSYRCTVRHTSGDNWSLVDIDTTSN